MSPLPPGDIATESGAHSRGPGPHRLPGAAWPLPGLLLAVPLFWCWRRRSGSLDPLHLHVSPASLDCCCSQSMSLFQLKQGFLHDKHKGHCVPGDKVNRCRRRGEAKPSAAVTPAARPLPETHS